MGVPYQYRRSKETILQSYSSADIVTGKGIVEFYAHATAASGAVTYNLSQSPIYSLPLATQIGYTTNTNFTLDGTINFDTETFKIQRTISGNVPFEITFYNSGGAAGDTAYIVCKLVRVHNGTETVLSSVISESQAGAVITPHPCTIIFTPPETTFTIGDTLRFKVEGWSKSAAGATNSIVGICHDPQNRNISQAWTGSAYTACAITASASNPTFAHVYVPFKVNI